MTALDLEADRLAADYLGEKLPAYRDGINARDLMGRKFPPIRYVAEGYVAEGLTVLAGAPKIGKSWMALNLAFAVAADSPAFGSVRVAAGDVLYLALEDNPRRLQGRLQKMGVVAAPERLTFCTQWPCLGEGAVGEIEAWADQADRPTLVVVDVLAKVRDAANGRDSAYDADYRTLTGLQELAGERGLSVLALHHTRKMDAEDPFDSVSGTRGITGAADTVLVLKRDNGTANVTLYGRGRDIPEIETAFAFERDSGTWIVLGAAAEVGKTDERQEIIDTLKDATNPLNAREVSDIIGKKYDTVRRTLARMAQAGEIERPTKGQYTCLTSPTVPTDSRWDTETDGTGVWVND